MKKYIRSFGLIFLITILANSNVYAKNWMFRYVAKDLGIATDSLQTFNSINKEANIAASPPIVSSQVYYCQNSPAVPLVASPSAGGTLNWYTTSFGGTASPTAPTPSTTTVGTTSYYVSETVGAVESTRSKIDVIVVADNGATILNFRCDPSQVLPADKNSSVMFDWSNNPLISNSYTYSYSVQGGLPISGSTGVSHFQVFGMTPGQSATLTLSSTTHPCVPPQTITCTVPCGTSTINPDFTPIAPFCSGSSAPILGTTSPGGITGTWSPAVINNTTSGSYVFTPDPILFPCATTQTLAVTVIPLATPTFTSIPVTVCQNATAPVLPLNSNNTPAISGTWSPATVDTSVLGSVSYTFTPNAGQCVSSIPTTVSINIVPVVTPNFANIPSFCYGTTAPLLAATSPNGIVGTWQPSIISNTASGTYLFTPNANQCATTQTLSVIVTPLATPTFTAIPVTVCQNAAAPVLPLSSDNSPAISGTWNPAVVNTSTLGSTIYTFIPDAGQCVSATPTTVSINIVPVVSPGFASIPPLCYGTAAPLLATTSPNGIVGTWQPSIISNTASGTYLFTPNPNQCATTQTLNVTVVPLVTPVFTGIPTTVCQNGAAPVLSLNSNNTPAISGTWSPAVVNTSVLGPVTYTFTPNAGQCVSSTPTTVSINIVPVVTPNFANIPSFCYGTTAPLLAATSPNGIVGTWQPSIVSNTASGTYLFTPNANQCATTQTLSVIVTPLATPTFTAIPVTVCQNATAPVLPLNSNNTPAISGTWSPAVVNTSVLGSVTYTFTPNAGQCVSSTPTTVSINIVPVVAPNFAVIPPFCYGTTAPVLATTSPNGIVGTWQPSTINNTINGTYVFTPNGNQCATTQTLSVTLIPKTIPNFATVPSFCTGTTAPILATTSPNGISGTWSPATISNTTSGSYIFTPNSSECATTQTLFVTINPLIQPSFTDLTICSGSVAPVLNTTSPNGITGAWLPSIIDNTTSGIYTFTPDPNQCAATATINVVVNPSNTLVSVDWVVTEAFSDNQVVTVISNGTGVYLYQLDDGPFQESPVFEHVSIGTHSVTVKDITGCSLPITRNDVLVIGYPKFFTPNNDGYNDYWNIYSLQEQLNSKILIFDRYGKLLKQINPTDSGWDGMYTGQPMPASDYWFTVEYTEQNISKIFKSHFSLKR